MIPTYCQAGVVLDAVDSALAQDYPNLEVIVADDASPDKTGAVVATRQDPRLRYHRNPVNLGRVANYRNTLYNLATGEWTVNLDGDDYYTDNGFISAAIQQALRDPEILFVSARVSTLGGMIGRTHACRSSAGIMSGCQALHRFAFSRFPLFHMATLYRRHEALRSNFYHTDTLSSDTESLWRLAVQGKVSCLDRDVGVWRVTESSASRAQDWKQRVDDLDIWPAVFREAVAHGMSPVLAEAAQRRAIAVWAYAHLSMLAMSGQRAALRKYMHTFVARFGIGAAFFVATRWRLYARMMWGCLRGGFRGHSGTHHL
jgi:glycosyltransferase involved in cell wall biosynthesis